MSEEESSLPWRSGRTFRVWRYTVGHSQLLLRSLGDGAQAPINVLFESVEFMRLRRSYPQLVLRLAEPEEIECFDQLPDMRLIRLAILSPDSIGLVACSRVTIREAVSLEDDSGNLGRVILSLPG